MKKYKETDTLSDMLPGDRVIMNDGFEHEAVTDTEFDGCVQCSLWNNNGGPRVGGCRALSCRCNTHDFHFVKIEQKEEKA